MDFVKQPFLISYTVLCVATSRNIEYNIEYFALGLKPAETEVAIVANKKKCRAGLDFVHWEMIELLWFAS